jgi:hypothetical protein
MTALPEAFHHRPGPDRFVSTHATAGPWSPKWQHGGPPSALLGRAMEQHAARDGFRSIWRVLPHGPSRLQNRSQSIRLWPVVRGRGWSTRTAPRG